MGNVELSSLGYRAYLYFQFVISAFLYAFVLIFLGGVFFCMDLSFDPDLSMFVEERKFLFFLFLVVFSVFVYSFYFVVSKLVDVTLMENGLVKVDGEFFERKDVRFNCEIIIFNLSVASINVGENKKYFVPKGAFSKIPMMIVKKAKNKRIKIFEEFVVEK